MTSQYNDADPAAAIAGIYTRLAGNFAARRSDPRDFIYAPEAPLRCCVCNVEMPSPAAACAAGCYYTPDMRKRLPDSFYGRPCAELERI